MPYTCPGCGKTWPVPPKACTCEHWSGVNVGESVRYLFADGETVRELDAATFERVRAVLCVELTSLEAFTEPTAPYLGVEASWVGVETAAEVSWEAVGLSEGQVARVEAMLAGTAG